MIDPKTLPTDRELRDYRFAFTGSGGEYFGIWIVNLLLSILTLGIYSAWAKVRREQYFHRNTLLDEQPFDYTGDPKVILKGRIIALIVLGVGSYLQELNGLLALVVTLFFLVIFPWVMVRSLRFRARNTRYRNLGFRFTGSTLEAFKVYAWIYLALAPIVVAAIVLAPDLRGIEGMTGDAIPPGVQTSLGYLGASAVFSMLLYIALMPVYLHHIRAFLHSHIRYGNAQGGFQSSVGAFYAVLVKAGLLSLLSFVAAGVVAVMLTTTGGVMLALAAGMGLDPSQVPVLGWVLPPLLFLIALSPFLLLPQALYAVGLTNLTYDCASLGEQRFHSDMKIGEYLWVLFKNSLLLFVTIGLAWPWAKVRLARYRLEHMALIASPVALAAIAGEAGQDVAALGEEAAEFLDFDISL